jgi:hypothetical protein
MTGTLDEWVQLGRIDLALLYDHKAFANIEQFEIVLEDLMLIAGNKSPVVLTRAKQAFTAATSLHAYTYSYPAEHRRTRVRRAMALL